MTGVPSYNLGMSKFRFHTPITVSYSDIDAQWHVNNKVFLDYVETARFQYIQEVGLFDSKSFLEVPFIVADVHVKYLAPIEFKDKVVVSMGITRIGKKSVLMEYEIASADGAVIFATAETVMVTYDYHKKASIPVSDEMRKRISDYEGHEF
jgi:acyl-CoA thioester hydrolase